MTFEEIFEATGYKPDMKPALEFFWNVSRRNFTGCICPTVLINGEKNTQCLFYDKETEECQYGKI